MNFMNEKKPHLNFPCQPFEKTLKFTYSKRTISVVQSKPIIIEVFLEDGEN